jgi:hypothetical protein
MSATISGGSYRDLPDFVHKNAIQTAILRFQSLLFLILDGLPNSHIICDWFSSKKEFRNVTIESLG